MTDTAEFSSDVEPDSVDFFKSGCQMLDSGADEDPRIAAAELERICPYVETGPDVVHWHHPEKNWSDPN